MVGREDPSAYIRNPYFHQSIRCPRTGLLVSFSEAGPSPDPESTQRTYPVLFYCLPSVASRYIAGPSLKLYAEHYGVRVVAIDRPGCGGSERCKLKDRVRIVSELTQSVLEHLNVSPGQVSLVSHSAGIIYALDLLARSPFFSSVLPSLYATSPWVPNTRSPLRLIPSPLVSRAHVILPRLNTVLQGVEKCFATLAALFTTSSVAEPWPVPDRLRPAPNSDAEKYRPLPPYHADHTLHPPKHTWKAIEKAMLAEPMQGVSQEFCLCLGRDYDAGWYETTLRAVAERSAQQGKKVDVEVFWALGDGMINKKARCWFDTLFGAHPETFTYDVVPIEGAPHDGPALFAETMGAVFEQVRDRWDATKQ